MHVMVNELPDSGITLDLKVDQFLLGESRQRLPVFRENIGCVANEARLKGSGTILAEYKSEVSV